MIAGEDAVRLEINHLFLTHGTSLENAQGRVTDFLERTILVKYGRVQLLPDTSLDGDHPRFEEIMEAGLAKNREVLSGLLTELDNEGIRTLAGLADMPKGYQSKLLHTVAHLLDGFFGIDSAFYNLEEDSHLVSQQLHRQIRQDPSLFYLIDLQGISEVGADDMRTFETPPDEKEGGGTP
jgi:hypothetical protein